MSRLPGPLAHVPTLTDIVHPASSPEVADEIAVAEMAAATDLQALVVEQVLQRIKGVLERRLHEATEQLIRAHVQALLPRLLDDIERVVRESVSQAFEREMLASSVPPDSQKPTLS